MGVNKSVEGLREYSRRKGFIGTEIDRILESFLPINKASYLIWVEVGPEPELPQSRCKRVYGRMRDWEGQTG